MNEVQRYRLISQVIDGVSRLARAAVYGGVVVCVAYYARDAVIAFAGKHTDANLAFSALANLQADRWFAYFFGASGVGYGLRERKLRRETTARLTTRPEALELRLHPGRTSSGLTPNGKTRQEDR